MTRYEYGLLWGYEAHRPRQSYAPIYKSSYFYLFQTATNSSALSARSSLAALNDVGSQGWLVYRYEALGGSSADLDNSFVTVAEQNIGWRPERFTYSTLNYLRRQTD